jgi:hypothetical protein
MAIPAGPAWSVCQTVFGCVNREPRPSTIGQP